jgi:palmitoyl-protein thioesterase
MFMFTLIKKCITPFLLLSSLPPPIPANNLPTAILHGIDSSSKELVPFGEWISVNFNTKVFNLEIGNGAKTSLYMPMSDQLEELCKTIYAIEELKAGFNFIGMSQGGLLARGYVERCNVYPVDNLITLVTPHGGEYTSTIKIDFYTDFFQEHLSPAGYWRVPFDLPNGYLKKCKYLPLLNNEVEHRDSETQMENIMSLENMVLIWSPKDTVLFPPESAIFSVFTDNLEVVSLFETELYINDLLGLKYLNEQNRLHMYKTNCSHVDHRNPECYDQLKPIFQQFLV